MNFLNQINLETFVLALGSMFAIILLFKWHFDDKNSLDVKSMIMINGKLSLNKVGQIIALFVSTWIIIYQTRHDRLTDWLFSGYMVAWSGAALMSKYLDTKDKSASTPSPRKPDRYNDDECDEPTHREPLDFRSLRDKK